MTFVTISNKFRPDICKMNLSLISKYKLELAGVGIGGFAGFLYYYLVGCKNGTCLISSNPFVSIPYGSLLGYFVSGLFKKRKP